MTLMTHLLLGESWTFSPPAHGTLCKIVFLSKCCFFNVIYHFFCPVGEHYAVNWVRDNGQTGP